MGKCSPSDVNVYADAILACATNDHGLRSHSGKPGGREQAHIQRQAPHVVVAKLRADSYEQKYFSCLRPRTIRGGNNMRCLCECMEFRVLSRGCATGQKAAPTRSVPRPETRSPLHSAAITKSCAARCSTSRLSRIGSPTSRQHCHSLCLPLGGAEFAWCKADDVSMVANQTDFRRLADPCASIAPALIGPPPAKQSMVREKRTCATEF